MMESTKQNNVLQATGFDHINMNVNNLDETTNFYQKHFGFKVLEEGVSGSGNQYKIIGIPGKLSLAIYPSGNLNEHKNQNVNHFGIHIDNYDHLLDYLTENKILYEYGGHVDYEKSRSIYIIDPNGYEIELSEKFGGDL